MLCTDPFLTFLKAYGYSVVRLPKTDIRPLQLLTRQGKNLERLGDLATVFVAGSNIPLPPLRENARAANISGQRTADISLGLGLSVLGNILGAMGGSKLGLDTQYSRATTVAFEFQDIFEDSVETGRIDQFLTDASVSPFSRHLAQLLETDNVYVTTATIKSTKFTVEAKTSNGVALEVSIPEIQEVVGGNVKVTGNAAVTSKVVYTGPEPLIFGFQAVRLFYDEGRYTAFKHLAAGETGMRGAEEAAAEPLVPEDALMELVDE